MRVTEEPLSDSTMALIPRSAKEGAELVRVAVDAPPLEIVTAVNAYVAHPPRRLFQRVDNWTDRALPLGSLWGGQLVRQFGWEWAAGTLHDYDDQKCPGVFDKPRSLAIYPFHYVLLCLENRVTPTILLAFNMLLAGDIPAQEPGGYANVMQHVLHIVPPD